VENIFRQSKFLIVASGTVTLEAALYGMPMVIIYKVSPISYWFGKALIRGIDFIGLVNLIYGGEVAPELIQKDASAENIAANVMQILEDSERLETIKEQLHNVQKRIGEPGASERVAALALDMI
jgi:lipid-A-disaccharide synthase